MYIPMSLRGGKRKWMIVINPITEESFNHKSKIQSVKSEFKKKSPSVVQTIIAAIQLTHLIASLIHQYRFSNTYTYNYNYNYIYPFFFQYTSYNGSNCI